MNRSNSSQPIKSTVSRKRIILAAIIFLAALLLMALPFYQPGDVSYVFLLVGRFHPLVLHFPIVLIILALILELLRRFNMLKKADVVITIILVAAAITSIIAITSGYLLYASGDYSGRLPEQHFWIGVITGASILLTTAFFFLYRSFSTFYSFYLVGLFISNVAVAYASHLGGSLTHGEDYLTEYLPLIGGRNGIDRIKPESEMKVYEDMLVPVFEAKCMSCHNHNRAKGEFSMVSFEDFIKGGESGNAGVIPGNADSSEVYRRLLLPEEDDDRMPPKGKTPLTNAEMQLLKFWISSGAHKEVLVRDIRKDSNVNIVVKTILPELKRYRVKQQIARLKNLRLKRDLDTLSRQLNIIIKPDSTEEENLYTVAMKFPPAPFTNQQFRELAPYANVFSKLSLVSSGIEDDGLYYIGQMSNVKSLYLQKTKLNGTGLVHLRNLDKLEVLNLSFTKIDDKAALELLNIPNLREVYLFQTNTSKEVIKALKEYKPSLNILIEEGPYF